MSSKPIYSQGALDGRNIRLIFIHPANDEGERLECTCLPFDIDKAPPYEALSYAWGTIQQPHEILCNGQAIGIQPSLLTALRRLRLSQSERVLWADAICINQSDNAEKSHQVPLMGRIYSNAERVIVWLGPGDSQKTQTAFETLWHIASACYQYNQENGIDDEDFLADHGAVTLPVEAFAPSAFASLKELFSKHWFSRIWCVQEIRLARDALVLWGQDELSWKDLAMGASWIFDRAKRRWDESDPLASYIFNVDTINATIMHYASAPTLLELFRSLRGFQASDPRDKVYGVLNLISLRAEREAIEVDYSKTVGQVYADTVLVVIRLYSRLTTLTYVTHSAEYAAQELGDSNEEHDKSHDSYDKTYRSWAPLWNGPTHTLLLGLNGSNDCPWKPCGEDVTCVPNTYHPETEQLCLRGIMYEKVQEVEDAVAHSTWNARTLADLHPFFNVYTRLRTAPFSTNPNEEFEQRISKLARTVTAGSWKSRYLQYLDANDQEIYWWAFMQFMARMIELQDTGDEGPFQHSTDWKGFEEEAFSTCEHRRMFWTEHGCLGLGPACMRAGDVVVVLHGGNTPYVLRPRGDKYLFMGQAYVDDIMNGQLMEKLSRGEVEEQDFCLI
jgi:hypothetical protein